MHGKDTIIARVRTLAGRSGLTGITPAILNDGGNLSIHLAPHPVVARIAVVTSGVNPDLARTNLERELQVACHLNDSGVPAIHPSDIIDPGPHDIGDIWLTFLQFIPEKQQSRPSPFVAFSLVDDLASAMKTFPGKLPAFGIWERICRSAERLSDHPDKRVQSLLRIFSDVNAQLRKQGTTIAPCHGDAHIANLMAAPEGWLWIDFEDVSLMPRWWDMVSYLSIPALFRGIEEPTFQYTLSKIRTIGELQPFGLAMIARILMSTLGNLDFALAGNGDLDFALKELDLAEDFIHQVEEITGNG